VRYERASKEKECSCNREIMDMSLLSTRRTSSDKAKSLQPNGICGRFDKTILSEFQKLPFGKKYANQEKI